MPASVVGAGARLHGGPQVHRIVTATAGIGDEGIPVSWSAPADRRPVVPVTG
jgi:hypothetical protein